MDELGPLEIEFVINNPEVMAQAKQVQETLEGVNNRVQEQARQASAAMASVIKTETNLLTQQAASSIEGLKVQIAQLQAIRDLQTNPANVSAYNQKIEELIPRLKQLSNVGKKGFDDLGNALPVEQTNKFQAAVSRATNITNIGARAVSQLSRQVISLGVGMLSFVIGAKAIEAIYDWLAALDAANRKLNEAQQSAKYFTDSLHSENVLKAVGTIGQLTENIELAKEGYLDKTKVLNEYNKELGSSLGYANSINQAEALLISKGQAYIQLTLLKAEAELALADAAKQRLNVEKIKKSNTDPNAESDDRKDLSGEENVSFWDKLVSAFAQDDNVTRKILEDSKAKALKSANDTLDGATKIYDKIQKEAAELAKKSGLDFFDGTGDSKASKTNESLKQRAALLQQISEAEDAFNRKTLSSDAAALQAIEDKYNDLKAKITAFNLDPKNANNKIGTADIGRINGAENRDIENQANLNENQYIQQDIEKKKKLYADYEAYKTKLGEDAAKKEFGDLLQSGKDYQTYLSTLEKAIPEGDTSGPIQQRRELVKKAQLEETQSQQEHLERLLEGLKSYETERNILTATYETNRQLLINNGHEREAAELDKQYKQELGALDDANIEKLAAVKELESGITSLSQEAAKKLIDTVQSIADAAVKAGTITPEELKKLLDLIDRSTRALGKDLPSELDRAGNALKNMANEAAVFNANLGDAINLLGEIVGGVGKAVSAYKDFKDAQQHHETVNEIASGLGVVGAAIGVVTAVVGFFKSAHDTAVQAAAQLKAYQDSLLGSEVKYNELLRDRQRTLTDISKLTVDQLKTQEQALALQKQQAQADYIALLGQIENEGQQITGEHTKKYGGFLGIARKTKVVQDLAGLSGTDYDTLEKLYTEGKLTDTTKAWFEQLQSVKTELDDIGTSSKAATDQLNQIATGTTANDIATAIVNGFEAGKRTAADFAGDFKTLMQNAAVSVFESDYLSGKIADFYKQFAAASASDGGLTPDKIAKLKAQYGKIIGDAGKQFNDLEKVVGAVSPSGSSSSPNTLTGQIQGITEPEANALEGAINGLRLTNLLTNDILTANGKTMQDQLTEMRSQTLLQMQIAANTKRTADVSEANLPYLKDIASNTNGSNLTNALRAAGV